MRPTPICLHEPAARKTDVDQKRRQDNGYRLLCVLARVEYVAVCDENEEQDETAYADRANDDVVGNAAQLPPADDAEKDFIVGLFGCCKGREGSQSCCSDRTLL